MTLKVQLHYNDSVVSIKPIFYCKDLAQLSRKILLANKNVDVQVGRFRENSTKYLKDSGLEDEKSNS